MENIDVIKERYLREPFNKRLGHLASDLARISSFLENPKNVTAVNDVLEESKFFIEWVAPEAPFYVQTLLSEMQSKLALWHYRLLTRKEGFLEKKELQKMTKNWSWQLLEISGLVKI